MCDALYVPTVERNELGLFDPAPLRVTTHGCVCFLDKGIFMLECIPLGLLATDAYRVEVFPACICKQVTTSKSHVSVVPSPAFLTLLLWEQKINLIPCCRYFETHAAPRSWDVSLLRYLSRRSRCLRTCRGVASREPAAMAQSMASQACIRCAPSRRPDAHWCRSRSQASRLWSVTACLCATGSRTWTATGVPPRRPSRTASKMATRSARSSGVRASCSSASRCS